MDSESSRSRPSSPIAAYALVGELGYLIAIPAVLFGFGGAYADKYWGTGPWLMIGGFLLAFGVSGLMVWNVVKRLEAQSENNKRQAPNNKQGSSIQ